MFNTRHGRPTATGFTDCSNEGQPFFSPAQLGQELGWPVPMVMRLLQLFNPHPIALAYQPLSSEDAGFFRAVACRIEAGESLSAIRQAPPLRNKAGIPAASFTPRLKLREQAAQWGFQQYCSLHYRQVPATVRQLASFASPVPVTTGLRNQVERPVGIAHQNRRTPHLK